MEQHHPFTPKSELRKSKFKVDNRTVLQDVEFENILSQLLEYQIGSRIKYERVEKMVIQILQLTEAELEKY